MKKYKILTTFLICCLCFSTIILIVFVSTLEKEYYSPSAEYEFIEKTYGEPMLISRFDIEEIIDLEGTYISQSIEYFKFDAQNMQQIIIQVDEEQEVKKNDVLIKNGNTNILSTINGVIKSIDYGNGIIAVYNLENLVFETYVGLDFDFNDLKVKDSEEVLSLINISNMVEKGQRKAYFKSNDSTKLFGEKVEYRLTTSIIEKGVLAAPKVCVYQKNKESYIRLVKSNGNYIEEIKVKTGISDEEYITISSGEEGMHCDSGYSKYISSFDKKE